MLFALLAFAVLGAPCTSRQSRNVSMLMTILLVTTVRLIGFASIVFASKSPAALIPLYVTLTIAVAGGVLLISPGTIIEPPAVLLVAVAALQAPFARRTTAV